VWDLGVRLAQRQLGLGIPLESKTLTVQRAKLAGWVNGRTYRTAKVHQSLVVITSTLPRQHLVGEVPQFLIRLISRQIMQVKQADRHTPDVCVQRGLRLAEGDRGDRAGGIRPDSRQAFESGNIRRDLTSMIFNDDSGSLVKVAGTAVVAKTLPSLQHFAFLSLCQAGKVGKTLQKALKIRNNRFHLRLLEHDLRDPNLVGCGIRTPGQRPGVFVIPS